MNYFICDVVGTFDGRVENRTDETKKLVSNLQKMMEVEGIDNLTFCFSTSEDLTEMIGSIYELEEILRGTNIKVGPHFAYDQVFVDGKARRSSQGKLFHLVDFLKNQEIDNLYIADATISIQDLIGDLLEPTLKKSYLKEHQTLEGYKPYKKLVQFVPGMTEENERFIGSSVTSIIGLNEALEKYNKAKVYRID